MFLNSGLTAALDRIAERAADVRRAYTPGATPRYDDVATPAFGSDFTLDPLAVSAPDGAYFVTEGGEGARSYTRDGTFALRDGRLVGADGRPIMGSRSRAEQAAELRVDPIDSALGRASDAAIESDGTLWYRRDAIDPRTGAHASQRVVVGRLLLARFPAGTRLVTDDGTHCTPPAGVIPRTGLPNEDGFGAVATMQRERSRVDIDQSLIRLKEAYLAFDALQAAETAKGHLGKTAMDLLK